MMLYQIEEGTILVRNVQSEHVLRPGTKMPMQHLDVFIQESRAC